jgi:gliding motility-associated-like protein
LIIDLGKDFEGEKYILSLSLETQATVKNSITIAIFSIFLFQGSVFSQGSGKTLSFNGQNEAINLGNEMSSECRSIEMWFKPNELIGSSNGSPITLVARDYNNGNGASINEFAICFYPASWGQGGKLAFFRRVGGVQNAIFSDSSQWQPGHWYHVAATIDPAIGMRMYINGVLQESTDSSTEPIGISDDLVSIGRWGSQNIRDFSGEIDEVRFWEVLRTTQEIRQYMCQKITGNESGLKSYYTFDSDDNDLLIDNGPNDFDAPLLNMDNTNRIFSGAPIGDGSVFTYNETGLDGETIAISNVGETLAVDEISSDATGIHLYYVNESPNSNTNLENPSNENYFGVFLTDISGDYSANYQLPAENCSCTSLFSRNDNSVLSWVDLGASDDDCSFELENESTAGFDYRAEYIPNQVFAGTLDVDYDAMICIGATATYGFNSPIPPQEIENIMWEFGNGLSSNEPSPEVVYDSVGTYSFSVELVTASGCVLQFSDSTDVLSSPENPDLFSEITLCEGSSESIDLSAYLSEWDSITGPGGQPVEEFTFTQSGTYAFTFNSFCSTYSHEIEVTEITTTYLLEVSPSGSICLDTPVVVSINNWSQIENNSDLSLELGDGTSQPVSQETIEVDYSDPGSYTITLSGTVQGCAVNQSQTVTVESPLVLELQDEITLCPGEDFSLDFSDYGFAVFNDSGDQIEAFETTSSGEYTFYASNSCGGVTQTVNVTVVPTLGLMDVSPSGSICLNTPVVVSIVNWAQIENSSDLTLDLGDGTTQPVDQETIEIDYSDPGSYTLSLEGTVQGCEVTQTEEITVVEPISFDLQDEITICPDESFSLDFSDYGFAVLNADGNEIENFEITSAGVYTFSASNSCGEATHTIEVNLEQFMPAPFNIYSVICPGRDTVQLGFENPGHQYQWDNGETEAVIAVSEPGQYIAVVTNPNGLCSNAFEFNVASQQPIDGEIFPSENLRLCAEIDHTLIPTFYGYPYTFQGDTTGYNFPLQESGHYSVAYTDGCYTYRDSIDIFIAPCLCPLFVPNVFTPNEDGLNDIFKAAVDCPIEDFTMQVFNRWGREVFRSNDINRGWNGGSLDEYFYSSHGVYYHIIRYGQDLDGLLLRDEISGHVTLLR